MSTNGPTALIVVSVLLAAWGVGDVADARAATLKVLVKAGVEEFTPQRLTIRAGDKVTWVNQDDELHSLVSAGLVSRQSTTEPSEPFINTPLPSGASYTQVFTQPGTYHYFCANHMQVWGVVVAEE
ncbi:MAG: cupredoxin domain-containing protein [Nitrospirota bacterium]